MPLVRRTPRSLRIQEILTKKRIEAGLTQQELAARMHRLQAYVSRIENGERRLTLEDFMDFSEALGLNEQEFLDTVREAPAYRTIRRTT
ncbi:helix-turn-helix domain-containing protein [Pararoseomonas indoligenes]|uniref:Helix-turn-helix transcriptional regulator n=1 Tax=Roseomonas indoligenes TaxID=2820811 RepID=A0A940S9Z8_9PROT|nr:helix-turn-helix transcriptional regulator [Pararoseomonas indoligenes]MBP0495808.1 helix-turn-helix transcriptional regulator [Pararoseomonas indoligenes]